MHIVLTTCRSHPTLSRSNTHLAEALEAAGARVSVLPWNSAPTSDFIEADLVLLRQTWDYQADAGGFAAWACRLEMLGARLEAPAALAVWNNDKRSLIEIEAPIPQTIALPDTLDGALERLEIFGDAPFVVKPVFGGDGIGVHRTTRGQFADIWHSTRAEVPGRPLMAQAFLPEIADGEWKLSCFDGEPRIAVHAVPQAGEFRINGRFGPKVCRATPPDDAVAVARALLASLGTPLIARVDGVMQGGRFVVTELELTDPDLHLHLAPEEAAPLARACLARAGA